MKRLLSVLTMLGIVGMLSAQVESAYACTCSESETIDDGVRSADLIVIGLVSEVLPDRSGENDFDAYVSVERYLKGVGASQIFVDDPGPCGSFAPHVLGRRVLFVLHQEGDYDPFIRSKIRL